MFYDLSNTVFLLKTQNNIIYFLTKKGYFINEVYFWKIGVWQMSEVGKSLTDISVL